MHARHHAPVLSRRCRPPVAEEGLVTRRLRRRWQAAAARHVAACAARRPPPALMGCPLSPPMVGLLHSRRLSPRDCAVRNPIGNRAVPSSGSCKPSQLRLPRPPRPVKARLSGLAKGRAAMRPVRSSRSEREEVTPGCLSTAINAQRLVAGGSRAGPCRQAIVGGHLSSRLSWSRAPLLSILRALTNREQGSQNGASEAPHGHLAFASIVALARSATP